MISVLIGVLGHYRRRGDMFLGHRQVCHDRRLANLLKLLVVLICLGAILQRVLPLRRNLIIRPVRPSGR